MSKPKHKPSQTTTTAPGGWWHNQPRRAHSDNGKCCPGCNGALAARTGNKSKQPKEAS